MPKIKRKTFIGYCPNCAVEQKLTFVGESKDLGVIWLRCAICTKNHHYYLSRIRKGRVLTKKELDRLKEMPEIVEYSPQKTYVVGQYIHHSLFDDNGKIVDKKETIDSHHLILVRFKHSGTKYLVEGANAL